MVSRLMPTYLLNGISKLRSQFLFATRSIEFGKIKRCKVGPLDDRESALLQFRQKPESEAWFVSRKTFCSGDIDGNS
jgi:hypothetical protein